MLSKCHAIFFAVTFVLVGCANPMMRRDVSKEAKYQIGYVPGQIYRLTADASIVRYCTEDGKKNVAFPHPNGGHVWSLEKPDICFLAPTGKYDENSVGTVPAGSRLRIERLEHQTYLILKDYEQYVVAYAQLLDAPYTGRVVTLSRVSEARRAPDHNEYLVVQGPQESLMQRVDP